MHFRIMLQVLTWRGGGGIGTWRGGAGRRSATWPAGWLGHITMRLSRGGPTGRVLANMALILHYHYIARPGIIPWIIGDVAEGGCRRVTLRHGARGEEGDTTAPAGAMADNLRKALGGARSSGALHSAHDGVTRCFGPNDATSARESVASGERISNECKRRKASGSWQLVRHSSSASNKGMYNN